MDGDANRAGNCLGGTDGGADGDGAEQQGCNGGNQGPRKLHLIRHFQSPFFRPLSIAGRCPIQFKGRANPGKPRKIIG
jgi:hypothetical protein